MQNLHAGYAVSIRGGEKVLEMDGGGGGTTQVCSVTLSRALENSYSGEFYRVYISPQYKTSVHRNQLFRCLRLT